MVLHRAQLAQKRWRIGLVASAQISPSAGGKKLGDKFVIVTTGHTPGPARDNRKSDQKRTLSAI